MPLNRRYAPALVVMMPSFTAHSIARIRTAADTEPIDWGAVRGAGIGLGRRVTTATQRQALQMLKEACDRESVLRAAEAVERAFGA